MVSPGDKEILKYKKELFLEEVEKSANYLGFPTPKVMFWKYSEKEHFEKGERAHIHIESNTICISEQELKSMTEEDIQESASHEVSHLRDLSHDTNFQNIQTETKASLWSPPSGTVQITEYEETKDKKPKKKSKPIKYRCNYHLCKKRGKTYQCKYCKGYFCKKHKKPKPMSMFLKDSSSTSKLLMEEYHNENAHPCMAYNLYWEKKLQKQSEEYGKALGRILKANRIKESTKYEDPELAYSRKIIQKRQKRKSEHSIWRKIKKFFSS